MPRQGAPRQARVRLRRGVSTAGALPQGPERSRRPLQCEGHWALGSAAYSLPIPRSSQGYSGDGTGHPCFSLSASTARSKWWKKQPLDGLGVQWSQWWGHRVTFGFGGQEGCLAR